MVIAKVAYVSIDFKFSVSAKKQNKNNKNQQVTGLYESFESKQIRNVYF